MNPFTRATNLSYQDPPESTPDTFICPAKFLSVSEALKHDPKRYLPLDKNGWKLELDARREFLHIFGEYPENPTLIRSAAFWPVIMRSNAWPPARPTPLIPS